MTPTQRALAELRNLGATAAVVERWNAHARIRQDLFGWMDVLYLLGPNTVGLQVTSGANHAARMAKLKAEPRVRTWLEAGNLAEIWSFRKTGPRGKRKVWTYRKEAVVLEDLRGAVA